MRQMCIYLLEMRNDFETEIPCHMISTSNNETYSHSMLQFRGISIWKYIFMKKNKLEFTDHNLIYF